MAGTSKAYRLHDYPTLAAFLRQEPVAVIAVPVDTKGALHAATLHYWNSESPLAFYFITNRESEKCTLLKTQAEIPCACVIGMQESTEFTLQMRGTLHEASAEGVVENYYRKQRKNANKALDAKDMVLVFRPHWAHFTDYKIGFERHFLEV